VGVGDERDTGRGSGRDGVEAQGDDRGRVTERVARLVQVVRRVEQLGVAEPVAQVRGELLVAALAGVALPRLQLDRVLPLQQRCEAVGEPAGELVAAGEVTERDDD
jgi:hypothetical protein